MVAAGAELREVEGSFEDAHALARRLAADEGWVNVNSINPDRIEGQASAAREVVEQLGGGTRRTRAPVRRRRATRRAYVRGFERRTRAARGSSRCSRRERATTVGSAIRIVDPVHREQVEAAAEVVTVTDAELLEWWPAIARLEGLFCEPASAAGVAGVAQVRPGGPRRLRAHRPRAEGSGSGRAAVRDEAVKTRAPATTANLGPGFDCAAVALDLWNEVEVTEGGDEPPDPAHIGIRAFGLVASPEGLSF